MYKIHLIIISDLVDASILRRPIFIVLFPCKIHGTSVYFFHAFVYTFLIYLS